MKTKAALSVLVLSVMLAPEAQAFYNPSTGRWLNRDPIGEQGGSNLYEYGQNDPVRLSDFLGNKKIDLELDGAEFTVEATLTASDVCDGGPLHFNVHVGTFQYDEGANYLQYYGRFYYDASATQPSNAQKDPISFDVAFSKSLPICPKGRQSGSSTFHADYNLLATWTRVLTIVFNWTYRCDCACKEVEPFKPSYSYFAFPPIKTVPPEPPRPGPNRGRAQSHGQLGTFDKGALK